MAVKGDWLICLKVELIETIMKPSSSAVCKESWWYGGQGKSQTRNSGLSHNSFLPSQNKEEELKFDRVTLRKPDGIIETYVFALKPLDRKNNSEAPSIQKGSKYNTKKGRGKLDWITLKEWFS